MVFVNPMFHVPDEQAHFFKAFAVAEGHLLWTKNAQGEGWYLPSSVFSLSTSLDWRNFNTAPGLKIDEKKV